MRLLLLLFILAVIAISITNLRVGLILQALACGPGYGDILEATVTFFSNVAPVTRAGLLVNVESWLPYHWHLICTTGDGPVHRARVTISESGPGPGCNPITRPMLLTRLNFTFCRRYQEHCERRNHKSNISDWAPAEPLSRLLFYWK